jgi:hypothetical protein
VKKKRNKERGEKTERIGGAGEERRRRMERVRGGKEREEKGKDFMVILFNCLFTFL